MNAMTPFIFEGEALRAILIDGVPWFVAKDVCTILELSNPTMAIQALDDDERAKFNLGRQGDTNIISESGLYTLVLRSRDAVTPGTVSHRFRKWMTSEVLPALRKTGQYNLGAEPKAAPLDDIFSRPLDEQRVMQDWLLAAYRTHGRATAKAMWKTLGLPIAQGATGNHGGQTNIDAEDDGLSCLNFLLASILDHDPISLWIKKARAGDRAAREKLVKHGIKTDVPEFKGWVAIANNNETLTAIFAETFWAGNWPQALRNIDGARPCKKSLNFGKTGRGTLLPARLFEAEEKENSS